MKTQAEERTVTEQAQAWIHHPPGMDAPARATFAAWLRRSPQHVQSYLQMLAVEREFRGLDPAREIDVDALIARAHDNVVPLNPGLDTRPAAAPAVAARQRRTPRLAAALVLFVGAGALGWLWWSAHGPQTYRTATGQQQRIKLPDGTMVELNTQSRLRTRFTDAGRDIYLPAGEALFDVHPDARPFRVHVNGATITDIGTQFNVYARPGLTTVSVLEGAVEISSAAGTSAAAAGAAPKTVRVDTGEAADITAVGRARPREDIDVAQATAWRQRRLWFQGTELGQIAEEFNRYNAAPKIIVEDETLRTRRFSGVFNADDPKSFVQFLYQDAGIDFDHDRRGFVIRRR
jgi:transmembrane sensor